MTLVFFCFFGLIISCQSSMSKDDILIGANQMNQYLPLLKGKNIAVVANQTSLVDGVHLVDSLVSVF